MVFILYHPDGKESEWDWSSAFVSARIKIEGDVDEAEVIHLMIHLCSNRQMQPFHREEGHFTEYVISISCRIGWIIPLRS